MVSVGYLWVMGKKNERKKKKTKWIDRKKM
jgi:hypothetical protein